MIDAPIFHVNGDDPEAVVFAAKVAIEFRQKFHKPVVIDMFCYRRHGHNEGDEPMFTQPVMYKKIAAHLGTVEIYSKRLVAETDMFYIDQSSELYSHMNANYVRIGELPEFDKYGQILDAVRRGDYFISMGEVLLPETAISTADANAVKATVKAQWTFPLAFGEIVWGNGRETFTQTFPLDQTRPFGSATFEWRTNAKDWTWARIAVWDVAGNGAFVNPVRR